MKRWLQRFMQAQSPEVAMSVLGQRTAAPTAASGDVATHEAASDPHPGYQLESEKGVADGYASLDSGALVPFAQIPVGATSTTVCVGDDARLSNARNAEGIIETSGPTVMPIGSIADGQYLRRSGTDIIGDTPSSSGLWTAITKGSDQTRTSTTTFAADDALTLGVTSGTRYLFRAVVFFDTAATPDIKFRWTGPATSMQSLHIRGVVGAGTAYANISVDKALSTADSLAGTGASGCYLMDGIVQFSANGTFALEWAQNTSDPANSTVLRGSYLEYRAI